MGLLTKPFWKRIAIFFRRWWERDMRAEQRRREEADCRRKAQQEVSEFCHDDILKGKAPSPPVEKVESAQAGVSPAAESGIARGQGASPLPVATLRPVENPDLQQEIQNGLHDKESQEREQK